MYNMLIVRTRSPGTSRVGLRQFRRLISEVVNRVHYGRERIILERHGSDFVAVMPLEDLKLLEKLEDAADAAAARKVLEDIKSGRDEIIPWKAARKRPLRGG